MELFVWIATVLHTAGAWYLDVWARGAEVATLPARWLYAETPAVAGALVALVVALVVAVALAAVALVAAPAGAATDDEDDRCRECGEHRADPHAPGCPADPDPVSLAGAFRTGWR